MDFMTTRRKTSGVSGTRKRHGGGIVPAPTGSSSCDGPPEELLARSSGEHASAREGSSGGESAVLGRDASLRAIARSKYPRDWAPSCLPRYSELMDDSVSREEYYDKLWKIECLLNFNEEEFKKYEKDETEWTEDAWKWAKQVEKLKAQVKEQEEGRKEERKEAWEKINGWTEHARKLEGKLKEMEDEMGRKTERERNLEKELENERKLEKERQEHRCDVSTQTSPPEGMEVSSVPVEAVFKEGNLESARLDRLEGELSRMAEAVALLVQTICLQGDRLTGDTGAPRPPQPSVACGAPKGGRPAGGGGGVATRKRGRVEGEEPGVPLPPSKGRWGTAQMW